MIPTSNRAYTLAYVCIAGMVFLCAIVLWKNSNQWQYVLDWFGNVLKWMVPAVIAVKEVGKFAGKFGDGYVAKHNGVSKGGVQ